MKNFLTVLMLCMAALPTFAADIEKSDTQIQLEASATLGWQMNLDTYANGFNNTANLKLQFPLLSYQSLAKTPSDLYGALDISNLSWIFGDTVNDGDPTIANITGTIGAKLVFKPFELLIYSAPSLGGDLSTAALDGIADVLTIKLPDFTYGTSLKLQTDELPFDAEVKLLSFGNTFTSNTELYYALGLDLNFFVVPDLLDIRTRMSTYLNGTGNFNLSIALPLTFDVAEGLTLTPASDMIITETAFEFDASLNTQLKLTQPNNGGTAAAVSYVAFLGKDYDLSMGVSFSEPADGGLIDFLGFDAAYSIVNFIFNADPAQKITANSRVLIDLDDFNVLVPQINFTYTYPGSGAAATKSLFASLEYRNNAIDNTSIVINWKPGADIQGLYDLNGEGFLVSDIKNFSFGTIAVAITITY